MPVNFPKGSNPTYTAPLIDVDARPLSSILNFAAGATIAAGAVVGGALGLPLAPFTAGSSIAIGAVLGGLATSVAALPVALVVDELNNAAGEALKLEEPLWPKRPAADPDASSYVPSGRGVGKGGDER